MKSVWKIAKTLSVLGQLGFTLITPPVLLAFLGWWLTERFGLGVWIIAVTILLGMITSCVSAWNFWKKYQASMTKKAQSHASEDRSVVYYRHE